MLDGPIDRDPGSGTRSNAKFYVRAFGGGKRHRINGIRGNIQQQSLTGHRLGAQLPWTESQYETRRMDGLPISFTSGGGNGALAVGAQCTLKASISCVGVGLHSGKRVSLTLRPAAANQGIV